MGLSVIIPSKTASNLLPCLAAVHQHEPAARLLVVDDGVDWEAFTDMLRPRMDLLEPLWSSLEVLAIGGPFVFARNCNFGIKIAGADDVVLLNDDALLQTPGGFMAMQREAGEHPEYGVIGAVTNVTGQALQQPQNAGLREVPHFAFVCVLIPRRTINRVGLLDERYCLDYGVEDRDYCEAVRRAGMKCGVFDYCYVDHGSLVSTFRGDPRAPKSFARNYALFKQKWGLAA
jgi:GT2 family glycosyltransferase